MTEAVTKIPTTDPAVYAFRIHGEVDADAMRTMSETMNEAFDRHEKVRMLLIFHVYDGATTGARLNFETLRAQLRSLANVERYAVVGAPEDVARAIETAGSWTSVETQTFDLDDEAAAWSFVGAEAQAA